MNDLMIDLETFGQEAGNVILSISAVQFNLFTGEIGESFHRSINIKSCIHHGLKMDPDTVMWWMGQNEEARHKLINDDIVAVDLDVALTDFASWIALLNDSWEDPHYNPDIQVWGRGPRFECAILSYAYKVCRWTRTPWDFRKERCVRTMEMFNPELKKNTPFEGILHDGISDAKHQIKYVCKIHNQINSPAGYTYCECAGGHAPSVYCVCKNKQQ